MSNLTDLTKITTPFGLIDEVYGPETQEALKAHGGPYETYHGAFGWACINVPHWCKQSVYRVKPAPPKPRECWSYGAHIHDTEAEAIAFRQAVADDHPGKGYEKGPITKWIEVLP